MGDDSQHEGTTSRGDNVDVNGDMVSAIKKL